MYPALAAVQSLTRLSAELDTLWIGSVGGMEEGLVKRAGLKIELISAAGLRGKNPVAAIKGVLALSRGYGQSKRLIRQFQPDALFVTGGYVSVPVTLAARQMGVPIIIYLPDYEPGLAIKFLARFADRVAVTTGETQRFFKPGLTVVTGYPVRPELCAEPTGENSKAGARAKLNLDNNMPVLLVFGGSRGARSINQAVAHHIEGYLQACQVVHISGKLDADWVRARRAELAPPLQGRYHVFDYLHDDMPWALRAADLVISRAGAGVMGEYPAIGLPSILAPLPIAGGHQWQNASYLTRHGAAIAIDNADLNQNLQSAALDLITDKQKLRTMEKAGKKLAQPHAANRLAQAILEVKRNGN